MTNQELRERAKYLAKEEQRITREIVELVAEVVERRAYVEYGFSSVYAWLREELQYSEGAAQRRIDAARLLKDVPAVKEGLDSGELSLTTLFKLQCAIRAEEKEREVSPEEKAAAVAVVEGMSGLAVEQKIVELFPASGEKAQRDLHRMVDEETVRISLNMSVADFENLKRLKEVLSHQMPKASDAQAIAYALKLALEKKDKVKEKPAKASKKVSKRAREKAVHEKYEGECCWVDPETGKTCGSKHQVQVDHIVPKAKGGTDELENLRLLCRQHNLYEAEKEFGKVKMNKYRKAS